MKKEIFIVSGISKIEMEILPSAFKLPLYMYLHVTTRGPAAQVLWLNKAMAMKEYPTPTGAPELEPYHQMHFSVIFIW